MTKRELIIEEPLAPITEDKSGITQLTLITEEQEYKPVEAAAGSPRVERTPEIPHEIITGQYPATWADVSEDVVQYIQTAALEKYMADLQESVKIYGWDAGTRDINRIIEDELKRRSPSAASPVHVKAWVECPICKKIIEIPEYNSVTRTDALMKHLQAEHGAHSSVAYGGDGTSEFHSFMLHAIAEMYGSGGIVVDDAKARTTPCQCVEYKPGRFWCTSKGVVGALTDEQERIYCNPKEVVDKPRIREKMGKWMEAVEYCKGILPPTDGRLRLDTYITCMSEQMKKAQIEE